MLHSREEQRDLVLQMRERREERNASLSDREQFEFHHDPGFDRRGTRLDVGEILFLLADVDFRWRRARVLDARKLGFALRGPGAEFMFESILIRRLARAWFRFDSCVFRF